ncbi:sigma-70 family RNA polymerase sigma factor [Microvirga antarctica]|uniref:sigma-70 family RNA polymerase sigma factor n=1 Tax=Microvirga antarctica TaxID=2819233 RepID=UPI001B30E2E9|nr:sigma-70 family RNA polymerase sigma factor [Microvirga antarctica]
MTDDTELPAAKLGSLSRYVQDHLGEQLRAAYGDPDTQRVPRPLAQLIARTSQIIRAHQEPVSQTFVDGIMASIPSLRAFAISLTRNIDRAEDLVQETVLRALSRREGFEEGTNMQVWLFTILRNSFFTAHRSKGREVEDTDGQHAATLVTIPDQHDRLVIKDLQAALAQLSTEQRSAIMLVGADGLTYEEAAQALNCAVGTVKSRVNRARSRLALLMGVTDDGVGNSSAVGT